MIRNIIFISVLLLLVLFIGVKADVFDYIGLTKNRIEIVNFDNVTDYIKKISIDVNSMDDITNIVEYDGTSLNFSEIPDLYGKDFVVLTINDKEFVSSFNDYKFKSFDKVEYKLKFEEKDSTIIIHWELKSSRLKSLGEFHLLKN